MKTFLGLLTVILCSCSSKIVATNSFNDVRVIEVYDGDTIKVQLPDLPSVFGDRLSIRVSGIDTPELRTKNTCEKQAALKAKELVEKLITGSKKVSLQNCIRGKYFRLVCDVLADANSLSLALVKAKLAYKYNGGTKKQIDWCKRG